MLILPQQQLEGIPSVLDQDTCNFELFTQSLHPVTNPKKDLQRALEKKDRPSISNIKLPHMNEKVKKYRPITQLNWFVKKEH